MNVNVWFLKKSWGHGYTSPTADFSVDKTKLIVNYKFAKKENSEPYDRLLKLDKQ